MESSNSTTEPEHIKRSPNCFMVFASAQRKEFKKLNPGIDNATISIMLGQYWSSMSDEQKYKYFETAYNLQKSHKEQYPDYKYQPQTKYQCSYTNKNNNQYTYIDSNIYEISQPISNSYLNTQSFIIDNNSCLVEKTQVIQLSREDFQSNQEYLEYVISRL